MANWNENNSSNVEGQSMSATPQPIFTVITVTYNCAAPLRRTLASLSQQDATLFEHVIVDGASKDDTLDVIKNHANSADYHVRFISEKDVGIYDAMNKGIALARGKFLIFINAGDSLMPRILEEIAPQLPSGTLSMLYGTALTEGGYIYGALFDKSKIAKVNICHQTIFYGRDVFELLGKYDLKYRVLADHAFNIKCIANECIEKVYVDRIISEYEGDGFSAHTIDEAFLRDRESLIKQYLGWRALWVYRIFHWETEGPRSLRVLIGGVKTGLKIILRRPREHRVLSD